MADTRAVEHIQRLQQAARAAEGAGRPDVATALLQHAEQLAQNAGDFLVADDAGALAALAAPLEDEVERWKQLSPASSFVGAGIVFLDCGDRGSIVLGAEFVSLQGKTPPEARLLGALYAQRQWGNRIGVWGTEENKFVNAVAAQMIGAEVVGYEIPVGRQAEAAALKVLWQPKLEAIEGGPRRSSVLSRAVGSGASAAAL